MPGAGKTMVAAIAINHICTTAPLDDVGLAYAFCNYKAQADQSALSLLSALLRQLVESRTYIADPVIELYNRHTKQKTRPVLDEVTQALKTACSSYRRVYIIVDALDECADDWTDGNSVRGRLIYELRGLQAGDGIRLLCTSRSIPEITQAFDSDLTVEVRASKDGVERFVATRISPKYDAQLKTEIVSKIAVAADGMFLLARLYTELLWGKETKKDVLRILAKLPQGLAALDDAYDKALKQIDEQVEAYRLLARRVISWITSARRPLTVRELCYAVSIDGEDKSLDVDDVYRVETVTSVCAGLVTVDKDRGIINLVHYTTQKYFERMLSAWDPGAQEEIAVTCLTYLSFDVFRNRSPHDDSKFDQRLAEDVFFDYAAHLLERACTTGREDCPTSSLGLPMQ
ncbi:hypothetical protein K432DRAFT_178875 [Lepidopterella palustris CBS 459.81]|uniref:NACHT domain-containing protein n=1 Tax=Lepidopterella palustris CBS 459.81 TaxID=1314670 RepID=A0A8E2JAB9_9PEZI|nr:hypothetical protein K432DRAFT_178875 [Lepidopterella palustris CBS 459.81]